MVVWGVLGRFGVIWRDLGNSMDPNMTYEADYPLRGH